MFLSLLLLTACHGAVEKNPQEVFYRNQTLEITLPENPTTGYLWYLEVLPKEILVLVQEDYESSSSDESLVGGGGFHHFYFTGTKEGDTTVTFQHYRLWEGPKSAIDTRVFHVKIGQDGTIHSVTK